MSGQPAVSSPLRAARLRHCRSPASTRPTEAVITLLQRCAEAGANLFHHGDLDPDGILILRKIHDAVEATVTPWLMTAAVHRRFARYGYALDRAQAARLVHARQRASGNLCNLAAEIAETDIGVEQEVIDPDDPLLPPRAES